MAAEAAARAAAGRGISTRVRWPADGVAEFSGFARLIRNGFFVFLGLFL